jgi:hypothetical protein
MKLEGGFIKNLGRVYGVYTLGFLGFVILMAILEQAGVSAEKIGWMFVGFTIAICPGPWNRGNITLPDVKFLPCITVWQPLLTGCQVHHLSQWPVAFT